MPHHRPPALGAALLALAACAGAATAQQRVTLGKPDAELAEPFTNVRSVRELPSGKVLVSDQQDKVVQLVDLAAGTAVKVGREGQGPGEYSFPGVLLGLPDGTTLLHDLLNRRFLVIGQDGKPGAILDLPRPPQSANGGDGPPLPLAGITDVRGADQQGRIYFQGSPFSAPNQPPLDSVPVLRWDRVRPAFDTVGYVRMPAGNAVATARGGNVSVRIGGGKVFTPTELWSVAGDGRIARVMPDPYRVVWMSGPRQVSPGPVQPYTPIRVTEADKELVRETRRKTRPMIVAIGPGGRAAPPPNARIPEPEFEETMPPFAGQTAVQVAPEGEVWVLRTRPAGDKVPTYDVFDRTGTLVKKVSLNPDSRVVGFGKGTVYVARTDEDDLQYLQRYRRP